MYSKYAYGVPDTAKNEYDFLVKRDTYDAGVQLRNDTTSSTAGNKGVRISHSSTDNANLDLRASTGATNSFAFRLQDDTSPSSFSSMLTLTDDNKSSTSAYGMSVGGRAKASQYFVGESDTRAPVSTGLYLGHDSNTTGYFNMNPGASGTGGFKFTTYDATGQNGTTNLSLDKFGYVAIPKYSSTTDVLDTESSSAIVSVNASGQLVRDFQQNARLRSTESRSTNLESTALPAISTKVNEIISRMNAVAFFNSNVAALDLGAVPLAYTAPAASVSLNMNVDLTTANSPTFQNSLIQSTATALDVNQSQVSIGSITSSTGLASAGKFTVGSGVNIEIIVKPDPTGVKKINPQVAVQTLAVQARSTSSPFVAAMTVARGVNPVNTSFVPVTKVIPTNTPAPTTPAPTTPAPTTPAPTTPAPTTPAPTTPAPTTPAPTTPAPTTPAPTQAPVTARYIKMTYGVPGTSRILNLNGIKVYTTEGYNVITPSTTTTSSVVLQGNTPLYGPAKLVDNSEGTFYHSDSVEDYPWAQIDLGSDMNIYKVEIVNREVLVGNALKTFSRANGLVVQCINNANTTVYTSQPVVDKTGSTTWSENLDGFKFFSCWPAKATNMFCTDENPSYALDPNVVTVTNYTGNESVVDRYGSAGHTWVAPVACKILSASFYVSGAVNNGGFAAGDINTSSASNSTGGHTWPTSIGAIDFYELVKSWNIPTVNAGETVSFSFTTMGADRYFKILSLSGNALPVKFSYIPIANIITPAPPTEAPAIVASTYRLKWTNVNYVFTPDTTVTSPLGNLKTSFNPQRYTLPAGTYSYSITTRNDANDGANVLFFDPVANSVVATLSTNVAPWTAKTETGTFTLTSQKTFEIRYSHQYYAYGSYTDITLTRS